MPRTIRFHLDEHVAHAVAYGLRRFGVDVSTTADAGLLGATDLEQFQYALAEQRVIFSEDEDFLILFQHVANFPGLAYCQQNTRTVGQIIRSLKLIWEIYEPDEMRNRIEFI
jgi:predicted nuclease of predicted toxin-antitoxin system